MARNSNENEEENIDPASVKANVKSTLKQVRLSISICYFHQIELSN